MKRLEFILVLVLFVVMGCSKSEESYFNMGSAYMKEGNYDKAIKCFQEAIKINSDYKNAYYSMGIAYNHKGNTNKVIECYMNYLKINPEEAKANYNSLVRMKVEIDNAWAEIDNQLKRRYDLIPNYVETVKGYAKHEKEVFTEVTKARASVGKATTREETINANNELTGALSRLLLVVERYPELKANTNFIRLQDELAGTVNRLAVARRRYNEWVKKYNQTIVEFPYNILTGMLEFTEEPFYKHPEVGKETPKVVFWDKYMKIKYSKFIVLVVLI